MKPLREWFVRITTGTREGRDMSDNDEEEAEEPAVELGEGTTVEGAPLARVASRLHYAIEKSEIDRREGETSIRTPDGPRELGEILAESDEVYFDTRQSFETAVREVIGAGPVPTAGGADDTGPDAESDTDDENGGFEFSDEE
jgi:hypothetical protein